MRDDELAKARIDAQLTSLRHTAEVEAPGVMAYLQALRELEVGQLRSEYQQFAERDRGLVQRFSRRTTLLLSVLVVGLLFLGVLSLKLTVDIQESRRKSIIENCVGQNMRNEETAHRLRMLVAELPLAERRRAEAGERSTVSIINAIVPVRDCGTVLHRAGF